MADSLPFTAASLSPAGQRRCPSFLNSKLRIEKWHSYIPLFWYICSCLSWSQPSHTGVCQLGWRQQPILYTSNYTLLHSSPPPTAHFPSLWLLGSERKKEQSKASKRVAVVAAGSLGSTKRKLREKSSLIPSDSRIRLNLQTNCVTSRDIPALCLPVMLQFHLWYSDTDRF